MTTRTTTTTREFDDQGRVVKETVVETTAPVYVRPYPWQPITPVWRTSGALSSSSGTATFTREV